MKLLVFLVCSHILFSVAAQAQQIYTGEYMVQPGMTGTAVFAYTESREGKLIKTGDFQFTYSDTTDRSASTFTEMQWKGRYKRDVKHGEWRYHHLQHHLQVLNIVDFTPNYRLNTRREFVRGVYNQGEPDGPWSVKIESISNYDQNRVISRGEATFKQAKLHGNLYYSEDEGQVVITGQADQGLMVDRWQFKYPDEGLQVTELRDYRKGFLTSLVKLDEEGDTLAYLHFPLSDKIRAYLEDGKDKNVLNAPVSLHFSDGYPRNSELLIAQDAGNGYLEELMEYLMRHDADFGRLYGLPLGANRMYYSLSPDEEALEESWVQVFYDYRSKVSRLRELSGQGGFTQPQDTIQMINRWIDVQEDLLEYIEPWDNIISKKEMGYYYRQGKLRDYVQDVLATDTLTFDDQYSVVSYAPYSGGESSFLFFLDHNIKQRTLMADSLLIIYERRNQFQQDVVQLLDKKKEVLKEKNAVQVSLQTPTGDTRVDQLRAYLRTDVLEPLSEEFLISTSDSLLSPTELKMNGEILHGKIIKISEMGAMLQKLAASKKVLEDLYTAYRFDPFTYSENVPYREFPTLYETFAVNMIDDLLKESQKETNVAFIFSNVSLAVRIQERLASLSDKEELLRRIEKRLTKRQSREEQLALLKP